MATATILVSAPITPTTNNGREDVGGTCSASWSNDHHGPVFPSSPDGWTKLGEDDDVFMMVDGETLSATSHQEASKVLEEWQYEEDEEEQEEDISVASHVSGAVIPTNTTAFMTSSTCGNELMTIAMEAVAAVSDNDEEDEDVAEDIATLMEVDEEIGSNFLNEEVFGSGPPFAAAAPPPLYHRPSPTGVHDFHNSYYYEPVSSCMYMEGEDDDDSSLGPLLEEDHDVVVMAIDSVLVDVITTPAMLDFDPDAPFDEERYQKVIIKLQESMKQSKETRKSLTMNVPELETYSRSKTVKGVLLSIEKSSKQLEKFLQTTAQRTTVV